MMNNLRLMAKSGNYERFEQRKRQPAYEKIRHQLLSQANGACSFCGIERGDHDILNLDGDYGNNHARNLALACRLCRDCLLMDRYSLSYDGGDVLIWLPELSQSQLNIMLYSLARLYKQDDKNSNFKAKSFYSELKDRAETLRQLLSEDIHPGCFRFLSSHDSLSCAEVTKIKLLRAIEDVPIIDYL
ncbi:MAG: HNH endonuclease [Francisellaceae bacterium]